MSHRSTTFRILTALFIIVMAFGCTKDPSEPPVNKTDQVDSVPDITILPHTKWQQSQYNPVFQQSGKAGSWDENMTNAPSLIIIGDTLHMWYEGSTMTKLEGVIQIGYAWSLDGVSWKRLDEPVLETNLTQWAYPHIASPVVISDQDTLRMWYAGGDYTSVGMMIGYATSVDGIHWTRYDQPVIIPDKTWNQGGVLPGPVLKEDGLYKMWFSGGEGHYGIPNNSTVWSTGYATSPDGINWTVNDEPVLEHGSFTDFDESAAVAGSIVRSDTIYEMWYSGFHGNGTSASIGFAYSRDGMIWQKYEHNPILNRSAGSDALYSPRVILLDNEYHMYYSAWHPGPTIHRAVSLN